MLVLAELLRGRFVRLGELRVQLGGLLLGLPELPEHRELHPRAGDQRAIALAERSPRILRGRCGALSFLTNAKRADPTGTAAVSTIGASGASEWTRTYHTLGHKRHADPFLSPLCPIFRRSTTFFRFTKFPKDIRYLDADPFPFATLGLGGYGPSPISIRSSIEASGTCRWKALFSRDGTAQGTGAGRLGPSRYSDPRWLQIHPCRVGHVPARIPAVRR